MGKKDELKPKSPVVEFVREHRGLCIVMLASALMFCAGTVFLGTGVSDYVTSERQSVVVAGINSLSAGKMPEASNFFMRASSDKDPLALAYLAWTQCYNGDFESAAKSATEAMRAQGGKYVYEIMGDLSLLGFGSAKGAAAAETYFSEAISVLPKKDRASAARAIYDRAMRLCQSFEDYKIIVNDACAKDSANALMRRGDMEFLGEGQVLSPKSAFMSWSSASAAGLVEASVRIAASKWYGYGMQRDMSGAYELFKNAARSGDPLALYDMGLISLRGNFNDAVNQGFTYLRASADRGFGPAISAVAILSLDAGMEQRDLENAYRLFRNAYEKGDITGALFYAFMTYCGIGCPESDQDLAFSIMYEVRRGNTDRASEFYDFMLKGLEPEHRVEALQQMVALCASQFYGEISFDSGDPAATVYHSNKLKDKDLYFTKVTDDESVTYDERKQLGNNCSVDESAPGEALLDGKPLMSQSFTTILSVYNPTSGVKPFEPEVITGFKSALPVLPKSYKRFHIDLDYINAKLGVEGFTIDEDGKVHRH